MVPGPTLVDHWPKTDQNKTLDYIFMFIVLLSDNYRCLRNKCPSRPYELIGFGAKDVAKPSKFYMVW